MIHVLHVLGAMNRGGIETFLMNIFRSVDRSRFRFDFLVNRRDNDYAEEIERLGGRIYFLAPRSEGLRIFQKNVDRFFAEHAGEYQAIHQHAASLSSVEVLAAARKYGIGIRIIHAHSSSIKGSKIHYLFHLYHKLQIRRLATHYLACSDKARHWLYDYTGCYPDSEILNNGVLTGDFAFDVEKRRQTRQQLKLADDEIALCHVGSFIPVKNHAFLLKIFLELQKTGRRYKLFLVGDGPLKSSLKEAVRTAGVEDKIVFLGVRSDVNRLMQGFDCLVFPSLFEGLPVTLVEAQAAGLPVICSDTISQMAKISDDTEFLSLNNPPSCWAEAVEKKQREHQRKDNTFLLRQAGFDAGVVAKRLENLYRNRK